MFEDELDSRCGRGGGGGGAPIRASLYCTYYTCTIYNNYFHLTYPAILYLLVRSEVNSCEKQVRVFRYNSKLYAITWLFFLQDFSCMYFIQHTASSAAPQIPQRCGVGQWGFDVAQRGSGVAHRRVLLRSMEVWFSSNEGFGVTQ